MWSASTPMASQRGLLSTRRHDLACIPCADLSCLSARLVDDQFIGEEVMAIPVVSVADVVTTESAEFAEFVFRLDTPSTAPVSLRYQSKDGSAKSAAAGVSDPDFIAVGR